MLREYSVRDDLGALPFEEFNITGANPLFVERYLLQVRNRSVSGRKCLMLASLINGSSVKEGNTDNWRTNNIPGQTLLIPIDCATAWQFSGGADVVVFYFINSQQEFYHRFSQLTANEQKPRQFSDALVSAIIKQILSETNKKDNNDQIYIEKLVDILLEQVYRTLTFSENNQVFKLPHTQFNRLQKVLSYINQHLNEELNIKLLAQIAGISQTHFRHIFLEATGLTVHRYIIAARLEQARKLLHNSTMPIAAIANACGFSSQSHFTSCFLATHSTTPAAYRKQISVKVK